MKDHPLIFEWDDANLSHIARHRVTADEAEQVVLGDPLDIEMQVAEPDNSEERLLQLGETAQGTNPATAHDLA